MNKVIGFVGVECFDIIHCLKRVIVGLGCSVCVVDRSDCKATACSVPGVIGPAGVEYDGADFFVNADLNVGKEFDYTIVDYGFSLLDETIELCDEIYVVSDFYLHSILRLKGLQLREDQFRSLIIRDRVCSKIKPEFVLNELASLGFQPNDVILLEDSNSDQQNKLLCQLNSEFSFKSSSKGFYDTVMHVLMIDFDKADISGAFKRCA